MATGSITIEVDEKAARAFTAASPEDKRRLELLLRLRLQDLLTSPPRSLQEIMDEVGKKAEALGLTAEILESFLHAE